MADTEQGEKGGQGEGDPITPEEEEGEEEGDGDPSGSEASEEEEVEEQQLVEFMYVDEVYPPAAAGRGRVTVDGRVLFAGRDGDAWAERTASGDADDISRSEDVSRPGEWGGAKVVLKRPLSTASGWAMDNSLPFRTLNYFTADHTVRKWAIAASHHPAFSGLVFAALLMNTAIVASFRLSAPPASLYPQGRGLPGWAGGFLDLTTAVLAIELLIVFISDGFLFADSYAFAPHKATPHSNPYTIHPTSYTIPTPKGIPAPEAPNPQPHPKP